MGCDKRNKSGSCTHTQCPYPLETGHGYKCVDIINNYCEVGFNCIKKCQFSFGKNKKKKAFEAFNDFYKSDDDYSASIGENGFSIFNK